MQNLVDQSRGFVDEIDLGFQPCVEAQPRSHIAQCSGRKANEFGRQRLFFGVLSKKNLRQISILGTNNKEI
jgi:hypothetical protein